MYVYIYFINFANYLVFPFHQMEKFNEICCCIEKPLHFVHKQWNGANIYLHQFKIYGLKKWNAINLITVGRLGANKKWNY